MKRIGLSLLVCCALGACSERSASTSAEKVVSTPDAQASDRPVGWCGGDVTNEARTFFVDHGSLGHIAVATGLKGPSSECAAFSGGIWESVEGASADALDKCSRGGGSSCAIFSIDGIALNSK